MSTGIVVNGKFETRPGVYATMSSGIQNPPLNLSFGNICIVDTGIGANYGGGSGISGALKQGADSIEYFDTPQQMRAFMKGGVLWDIAQPLFKPSKRIGARGVSRVYYVRAAATTQASVTLTFSAPGAGTVTFKTKDEGLNANGSLVSNILRKGYAVKFVAGSIDPLKYKVQFWIGTYKGIDSVNSTPYDETTEANSTPAMILESSEVSQISELTAWCTSNAIFKQGFEVATTGNNANFLAADLTTNSGYLVFAGATETYNATHLASALEATKNLEVSFYLFNDFGASATSLNNTSVFTFLTSGGLKYQKFGIVAGGADSATFSGTTSGTSQFTANYYNSDLITTIHGQMYILGKGGATMLKKSQFYKAAMYLGRVCGLDPQTPITMKDLDIAKEVHLLTEDQQQYALSKGITYTYYDYELDSFVVGQGITTLQNNNFLVNEDGTSHDLSVKRITAQLNKEIIYNAKRTFFGKNVGPNQATITAEDISSWLSGFLDTKMATTLQDNLIIRYGNISVTVQEDTYIVRYEFVPNFPVNKIVFAGVILDK